MKKCQHCQVQIETCKFIVPTWRAQPLTQRNSHILTRCVCIDACVSQYIMQACIALFNIGSNALNEKTWARSAEQGQLTSSCRQSLPHTTCSVSITSLMSQTNAAYSDSCQALEHWPCSVYKKFDTWHHWSCSACTWCLASKKPNNAQITNYVFPDVGCAYVGTILVAGCRQA